MKLLNTETPVTRNFIPQILLTFTSIRLTKQVMAKASSDLRQSITGMVYHKWVLCKFTKSLFSIWWYLTHCMRTVYIPYNIHLSIQQNFCVKHFYVLSFYSNIGLSYIYLKLVLSNSDQNLASSVNCYEKSKYTSISYILTHRSHDRWQTMIT
jgi:hypothetical protein